MGEGIFFTGSCRRLGIGTVDATSLKILADFLFGVGVANFIFCRRVAFLFCVAAVYVMCDAIFSGFSPLVLVHCLVVALAGMVETEFSAPLVLLQGTPFLVDCRHVRPSVACLAAVLHLRCCGPPQRFI